MFFPFLFASYFQESNFRLIKSIPTKTAIVTTDNLGNIYITKGNSLEKYNSKGEFLKKLSDKNLGNLSFVDTRDPLKILLYYKSFQRIIFIDNMLSPSGNSISLDELGLNQTSLVCTSHNSGFWIYNQQNLELIRFDQNLQITQQTGSVIQITGEAINPNFMTECNNKLYINDPQKGILVFDIFGTYSRKIPILGVQSFQVADEQIIYLKNDILKSHNLITQEESEIQLPTSGVLIARTEKEKLYLLKPNNLDIYEAIK